MAQANPQQADPLLDWLKDWNSYWTLLERTISDLSNDLTMRLGITPSRRINRAVSRFTTTLSADVDFAQLDTPLSEFFYMKLGEDNNLFVCSRFQGRVQLKKLTWAGSEEQSVELDAAPNGMTTVERDGHPCVALSFRSVKFPVHRVHSSQSRKISVLCIIGAGAGEGVVAHPSPEVLKLDFCFPEQGQ